MRSLDTGKDVGLSLVADGFCKEFAKYPHPRSALYKAAEASSLAKQHPLPVAPPSPSSSH